MAAKKSGGKRLWLGCFVFFEEESEGSFQMVVEASGVDEALELCASRLAELDASSTLFDGASIFLDGILDLGSGFKVPALVNFLAGSPRKSGTIWSDLPEQTDLDVTTYGPDEGRDEPFFVSSAKTTAKGKKTAAKKKAASKKTAAKKKKKKA